MIELTLPCKCSIPNVIGTVLPGSSRQVSPRSCHLQMHKVEVGPCGESREERKHGTGMAQRFLGPHPDSLCGLLFMNILTYTNYHSVSLLSSTPNFFFSSPGFFNWIRTSLKKSEFLLSISNLSFTLSDPVLYWITPDFSCPTSLFSLIKLQYFFGWLYLLFIV